MFVRVNSSIPPLYIPFSPLFKFKQTKEASSICQQLVPQSCQVLVRQQRLTHIPLLPIFCCFFKYAVCLTVLTMKQFTFFSSLLQEGVKIAERGQKSEARHSFPVLQRLVLSPHPQDLATKQVLICKQMICSTIKPFIPPNPPSSSHLAAIQHRGPQFLCLFSAHDD